MNIQAIRLFLHVMERGSLRHVEVFCDHLYVKLEDDRLGPIRWQFTGEPEQSLEGEPTLDYLRQVGDRMNHCGHLVHQIPQVSDEAMGAGLDEIGRRCRALNRHHKGERCDDQRLDPARQRHISPSPYTSLRSL